MRFSGKLRTPVEYIEVVMRAVEEELGLGDVQDILHISCIELVTRTPCGIYELPTHKVGFTVWTVLAVYRGYVEPNGIAEVRYNVIPRQVVNAILEGSKHD